MADNTPIEWTDATWNTVGGCTRVHDGCTNCYAEIMAARFSKPGQWGEGLAKIVTRPDGSKDHRWTGAVRFNAKALDQPLRWKKPRLIFVNSTADTFHDGVTDAQLDQIFAVMALCPHHTFQVLTKRPERAREYLSTPGRVGDVLDACLGYLNTPGHTKPHMVEDGIQLLTLPNVWIGTSISDQAGADAMIPHLLATPAAVRFVSAEPLLGPVDLAEVAIQRPELRASVIWDALRGWGGAPSRLDWVIVGGESGHGARPMHPDWARSLRDQCNAAGVAFFFKQWGEFGPQERGSDWLHNPPELEQGSMVTMMPNYADPDSIEIMARLGTARAGRLLDGREWNQMPGEQP
jgi:protein gp37